MNEVTRHLEKHDHLPAAIEQAPGVLVVDQPAEQEVVFINPFGLLLCIDRGARNPRQDALSDDADPDFFLSQSSSILNLPDLAVQ